MFSVNILDQIQKDIYVDRNGEKVLYQFDVHITAFGKLCIGYKRAFKAKNEDPLNPDHFILSQVVEPKMKETEYNLNEVGDSEVTRIYDVKDAEQGMRLLIARIAKGVTRKEIEFRDV